MSIVRSILGGCWISIQAGADVMTANLAVFNTTYDRESFGFRVLRRKTP